MNFYRETFDDFLKTYEMILVMIVKIVKKKIENIWKIF